MSSKILKQTNSLIADWRNQWVSKFSVVESFCKRNLKQVRRWITSFTHVPQIAKQPASQWIETQTLTAKLGEQMAKGAELDALIRQKLGGLGYGV